MIRAYQEEDFEQVVELYKNKSAYGGNYDPERDEQNRLLATAKAGNLFVSEYDSHIVGTVMILDNPHSFWLLRFAVDPKSEYAQESAKELDDMVYEIARSRGHDSIIVYTDPYDNQPRDRYRDLAYIETSDYRCFWKGVK